MSGIYYIRNAQNNKLYIGKTSRAFHVRWKEHAEELRAGKHHNTDLQADYYTLGERAFYFGKLLELATDRYLDRAERTLILWHIGKYTLYNIEGVLIPFDYQKAILLRPNAIIRDSEDVAKESEPINIASQRYNTYFGGVEKEPKMAENIREKIAHMQRIALQWQIDNGGKEIPKSLLLKAIFDVSPGKTLKYRAASKLYDFAQTRGMLSASHATTTNESGTAD